MTGFEVLLLVLVLIFVGVPISYSLLGSSLLYGFTNAIPLGSVIMHSADSVSSPTLLAIPGFIFAAALMNTGGITTRIFDFVRKSRIGSWRGGLAQVNIVASLIFSGMSGAALADIGGLGRIEIKAMEEAGYKTEDAAAITMSSSLIGPIFPPSIPLLLYALVAEVSGVDMLISGIIPALVIAVFLIVQVGWIARRYGWPISGHSLSGKEKWQVFYRAFPALMMPVVLVGGLISGWFSPIELAVVSVVYAFVLSAFVYRDLNLKGIVAAMKETVTSSGSILLIAAGASAFAWVITFDGVASLVSDYMVGFTDNRIVLLAVIVLVLLVWGMILDMLAALLIFTPILLPGFVELGGDPIQFGVVVVFTLIIGLYTPPVGVCLFLGSQITGIKPLRLFRVMMPYYLPIMLALAACVLVPEITTWLPHALN